MILTMSVGSTTGMDAYHAKSHNHHSYINTNPVMYSKS